MVYLFVPIQEKLGCKKKLTYEGIKDKFITYYKYKSKYPHAGVGKRIQF